MYERIYQQIDLALTLQRMILLINALQCHLFDVQKYVFALL